METTQYVLHIVNGALFACALYIHARGYFEVRACRIAPLVRRMARNVCLAAVALCVLFVFLQIDWVVNAHNQVVGDSTSWAWLLFDYALGVYLLLLGMLIRVFVNWKGSYRNSGEKRRATDA